MAYFNTLYVCLLASPQRFTTISATAVNPGSKTYQECTWYCAGYALFSLFKVIIRVAVRETAETKIGIYVSRFRQKAIHSALTSTSFQDSTPASLRRFRSFSSARTSFSTAARWASASCQSKPHGSSPRPTGLIPWTKKRTGVEGVLREASSR